MIGSDGRVDNTAPIMADLTSRNRQLINMRLSKRFAKEATILGGIDCARSCHGHRILYIKACRSVVLDSFFSRTSFGDAKI